MNSRKGDKPGTIRRLLLPGGWRGAGVASALLVAAATSLYAPAALAFPYREQVGSTTVYATDPIPGEIAQRIERADRLLASSPLYQPDMDRTLVLTDGGWRWKVMAAGNWNAVALRRPFGSTLVFNKSDVARDSVSNGARTLSGTIAHECVHVLTAKFLGELRFARLPEWKREGYADYVAREPRISAEEEARIRAKDPDARVLAYHQARRRVAARLAKNGHSVEKLFSAD